jgi:hypothetical protein
MNSMIETGIIIAVVSLAALFVALRIIKTFRSKRPSCCSGGGDKCVCPHCPGK